MQPGSPLRNSSEPGEAVWILSEGRERFPAQGPMRFFPVLALYDAGRHREALAEALELTPFGSEPEEYGRAMRAYLDALKNG